MCGIRADACELEFRVAQRDRSEADGEKAQCIEQQAQALHCANQTQAQQFQAKHDKRKGAAVIDACLAGQGKSKQIAVIRVTKQPRWATGRARSGQGRRPARKAYGYRHFYTGGKQGNQHNHFGKYF